MLAIQKKITEIENEMNKTQKNKATEGHFGLLKARLAKLKREIISESTKGSSKSGEGFDVSKSGIARVGFIGLPSVGKSTLLTKLTETVSESAAYEFTTLTCIPGALVLNGCKIQLLDLPGIIEGAKDGKGRGKQVIGVAKTCDLLLIILDSSKTLKYKEIIEKELEGFGIRLNKTPPKIKFTKRDKGGIGITKTVKMSNITDKDVYEICKEYRITSAEINFMCDASIDQLIDAIEGNRKFIPTLYVLNKIDTISIEELNILSEMNHSIPISASKELNFNTLRIKIWEYLDMIRIYTKTKNSKPDYEAPFVLKKNKCKIKDLCSAIHKNFIDNFKHALVWGSSVKHTPQKVGKEHLLEDEDVVYIVLK